MYSSIQDFDKKNGSGSELRFFVEKVKVRGLNSFRFSDMKLKKTIRIQEFSDMYSIIRIKFWG